MPIIYDEVNKQLKRQKEKWGTQDHLPYTWIAILTEEVGEVCQAALKGNAKGYREEILHVIAVAVAQLESWDRNNTMNASSGEG